VRVPLASGGVCPRGCEIKTNKKEKKNRYRRGKFITLLMPAGNGAVRQKRKKHVRIKREEKKETLGRPKAERKNRSLRSREIRAPGSR